MPLNVETGSGSASAESFASVADADTYHAVRGNPAWVALATADKEAALRKATDWLEQQYLGLWAGNRKTTTQALAWPRTDVFMDGVQLSSSAVPIQVVRACCELAARASSASLTVDQGAQVKSEQVGHLGVTYADGARQQTKYAAVEDMLRPLLSGASRMSLVRV